MCRYLLRCFNLLIPKRWNYKSVILVFILIFFSTTTFIHIQYNNSITVTEPPIDEEEIIQVVKKRT